MQQPTTAEVRLDEHKAASSAQRSRAFCRFGCQRVGCDRISLRRASLRRKIATNNFGIREMSVWMNTVDDYVWAVIVAPLGTPKFLVVLASSTSSYAGQKKKPCPKRRRKLMTCWGQQVSNGVLLTKIL